MTWDKDSAAAVAYTAIVHCKTLEECLKMVIAHEDMRRGAPVDEASPATAITERPGRAA